MIRILASLFVLLMASIHSLEAGHGPDGPSAMRTDGYLYWEESDPLRWEDFRGQPERNRNVAAMTASAIEYRYDCKGEDIEILIAAVFLPGSSWVHPSDKTPYMLSHEQLHFDITELYARKMRKAVQAVEQGCRDRHKIDKLAAEIIKEWTLEQERYDRDTRHSINKEQQQAWSERIAAALLNLQHYAIDQ